MSESSLPPRTTPRSGWGERFVVCTLLLLVYLIWKDPGVRTNNPRERQAAFANMIGTVVFSEKLVEGKDLSSRSSNVADTRTPTCQLALTPPPADDEDLKVIYETVRLSPISREIALFNAPRKLADSDIFRVDKDCQPIAYFGSPYAFRAANRARMTPFTLRYPDEDDSKRAIAFFSTAAQSRQLAVTNASDSELAFGTGSAANHEIGEKVRLTIDGKGFADWDRSNWSVLKNFDRDSGVILRLRNKNAPFELSTLQAGDWVAFPPETDMFIAKKTPDGIKNLGQLSWRMAAQAPLFVQRDNGKFTWRDRPSAFEVQVVEALKNAGPSVRRDVVLTLRPRLSEQLQSALNGLADDMMYGSVAMMDAHNGEIVAVAAHPQRPFPKRFDSGEYEIEAASEEFLRRRVIGSVAKVPIGLAVLASQPALSSLAITPYEKGKVSSILGRTLDAPLSDHGSAGCGQRVDFSCFVSHSLNRYAATLLALGAVRHPDEIWSSEAGPALGNDRYSFKRADGQLTWVNHQPRSFVFKDETVFSDDVARLPWAVNAAQMYDMELSVGQRPPNEPELLWHTYFWRNAYSASPPAHAFTNVSPEKGVLRLNLARSFRSNYIPIILGQGESTWSTLKVAETFARVVTDKKVQATFVRSPNPHAALGGPLVESPLPGYRDAHATMINAMRDVIASPGATAHQWLSRTVQGLQAQARANNHRISLVVYAKTGTPRVEESVAGESEMAIDRLSLRGEITARILHDERYEIRYHGEKVAFLANDARDPRWSKVPFTTSEKKLFGDRETRADVMDLLATVNRQPSRSDQDQQCRLEGSRIRCRSPQLKEYEGRNFAAVASVICDEVEKASVAISFSMSHNKQPWRLETLVRQAFSNNGPVWEYLKLKLKGDPQCRIDG